MMENPELIAELAKANAALVEANTHIEDLSEEMLNLHAKLAEVNSTTIATDKRVLLNAEELSVVLAIAERKFKEKFDECVQLRVDGKVSEYTLTLITMAHEFIFCAKNVYASALKEDSALLERPAATQVNAPTVQ